MANGAAAVDLQVSVPILNGGLVKAGPGTMRLTAASTFSGSTTIQQGTLQLGHAAALAASKSTPLAGGTLSLSDEKGRRVVVPVSALAYVEIGEPTVRKVGFGNA